MADPPAAADGEHAMRSSADALTKQLYSTVMHVFANKIGNVEEEYDAMVEALHSKHAPKMSCPTPSAKSKDNRGIIAKKLLDGYTFQGDMCEKCVMPLMVHDGQEMCVVCKKAEEEALDRDPSVSQSLSNDTALALAATTGSDETVATRDSKEAMVSKELSEFNERRSRATHVYTAKLLKGYVMQDNHLCAKCDMPMMKYQDSIDCVFCPKEEAKKEGLPPAANTPVVNESNEDKASDLVEPAEAPKTVKKLSQAEKIALRVRNAQAKASENADAELEKAEADLLKTMETLGVQGDQSDEVTKAFKDYLTQKKADRKAEKWLKEAENGILEAESLANSDELNSVENLQPSAAAIREERDDSSGIEESNVEYRIAPPITPKVQTTAGCTIGGSLFPRLKSMFASASHPIKVEEEVAQTETTANPVTIRLEPKTQIASLIAAGWEVSTDVCPKCELPVFTNGNGQPKRCVTCGPVVEGRSNGARKAETKNANLLTFSKDMQDHITNKMVRRIMQGWIMIEGQQCPSCYMPTMLDPTTHCTQHCITCGVLQEPGRTHRSTSNEGAMQSLEVATSMAESRRRPIDPTPTVQTLHGEPTPNMQAVRNKYSVPAHMIFAAHDAIRYRANEPRN